MWSRLRAILLLVMMLNACARRTDTAGTEPPMVGLQHELPNSHETDRLVPCLLFDPIGWSRKDTDQTIIEVKRHNRTLEHYCSAI